MKPAASVHPCVLNSETAKYWIVTAKQATSKRSVCHMGGLLPPFCTLSFVKLIPYIKKAGGEVIDICNSG